MNKEELSNYLKANAELSRLKEKISDLREKIEKPRSASYFETTKGSERKDFTDYIDKLIDLSEIYAKRARIIIDEQIRIETAIEAIDDPTSRAILGYRYIDSLDWQSISEKINYSYVHTVYRLHPKALNEFENINL